MKNPSYKSYFFSEEIENTTLHTKNGRKTTFCIFSKIDPPLILHHSTRLDWGIKKLYGGKSKFGIFIFFFGQIRPKIALLKSQFTQLFLAQNPDR